MVANQVLLRVAPILFILLWSSAFIAGRVGLTGASPLAYLTARFGLAALVLIGVAMVVRTHWALLRGAGPHLVVAGVLMNALYLSGGYLALKEINAATVALIGAMHPLITAALARPFLGERLGAMQWLGLGLGMAGVTIVVGGGVGHPADLVAPTLAFLGVCSLAVGTIYYRKYCRDVPLRLANTVQLTAAAVTCAALTVAVEEVRWEWSAQVVTMLLYLTVVISLGAQVLFMFMLRHGKAGMVASNFYLTPGVTAVMGWLLLDESLRPAAIAGLAVASLGVWLAQRGEHR
jgi:drug/metabolite transporter (DMT)-like permease